MSTKRIVARNVVWNWCGLATELLVGFYTVSFLIRNLGQTNYGLWILIGAMTGYFGLLDFGVRGSVGRYIAFYRAANNHQATNRTLNSALAILLVTALGAVLSSALCLLILERIVEIPDGETAMVRTAFAVSAFALALSLVLSLFDATLWACQRFDLLNLIDIANTLLRLGLTIWFVRIGYGIVGLACIAGITTLVAGLAKGWLSFRVIPELRIGGGFVSRIDARTLLEYGSWNAVISIARVGMKTLIPLLISGWFGLAVLTMFSLATRLLAQATQIIGTATSVITPVVASLDALDGRRRQQRMFIEGSKLCTAAGLFFCSLFFFLGRPLIVLWVGPELQEAANLLLILSIGELLPMSQCATASVLLGTARHRLLAVGSLAEIALVIAVFLFTRAQSDLRGICVSLAVIGALCRGLVPMLCGCRLQQLLLSDYFRQVVAPPIMLGAVPTLMLAVGVYLHDPTNWIELIAYGLCYSTAYAVAGLLLINDVRVASRFRQLWQSAIDVF